MSTRTLSILSSSVLAGLTCCSALLIALTLSELPSRSEIRKGLLESSNWSASEVLDRNGQVVATIGNRRQYPVRLNQIPKHVISSFIATEDERFYSHFGIDPLAIVRAGFANLRGLRIDQGASTITQQLVRMTFLSRDKTWRRKIREAALSLYVEMIYDKDQILNFYLNRVYLGNHAYGIESAARHYFRKRVNQLTLGEGALLAGLPQAPSAYAPNRHLGKALNRRRTVLKRLVNSGRITTEEYRRWEPHVPFIAPGPSPLNIKAPYFVDYVTQEVKRRLGHLPSGIKIFTTLDSELQNQVVRTVAHAAVASDKSRATSANASVDAGDSTGGGKNAEEKTAGARFNRNAYHNGQVESAFITLDSKTGAILAMQGGRLYKRSQYNRSVLLRRPIGELVTPLLATLALDRGYGPEGDLRDLRREQNRRYESLQRDHGRQLRVRDALIGNLNPENFPFRRSFGYQTLLTYLRSFLIGTDHHRFFEPLSYVASSPLQMASAYQSVFNHGQQNEPFSIDHIAGPRGQILFQSVRTRTAAVDGTSFDRIRNGRKARAGQRMSRTTANVAARIIKQGLRTGVGVVGTSDGNRNGWGIGYASGWVSAIWLGAERGRTVVAASADETKEILSDALLYLHEGASDANSGSAQRKRSIARKKSSRRSASPEGNDKNTPSLQSKKFAQPDDFGDTSKPAKSLF